MVAQQRVAAVAPDTPRLRRVDGGANGRIKLVCPASPVGERDHVANDSAGVLVGQTGRTRLEVEHGVLPGGPCRETRARPIRSPRRDGSDDLADIVMPRRIATADT